MIQEVSLVLTDSVLRQEKVHLVHEGLQGVEGGDEDIQSQVKLVAVYEQRVSDVPLNDTGLAARDVREVINEVDASTAGEARGLQDPDIEATLLAWLHRFCVLPCVDSTWYHKIVVDSLGNCPFFRPWLNKNLLQRGSQSV